MRPGLSIMHMVACLHSSSDWQVCAFDNLQVGASPSRSPVDAPHGGRVKLRAAEQRSEEEETALKMDVGVTTVVTSCAQLAAPLPSSTYI